MKIQLPNGKQHTLDDDITLEGKIVEVNNLLKEWEFEIHNGWDSNAVKFFLDSLSNYLVWHKDVKDSNKEEYTGSRDDVINRGYEPCKKCNP